VRVDINGSIYPLYSPRQNNVNSTVMINTGIKKLIPGKPPKENPNRVRFWQEKLQNLDLMNDEVTEKDIQNKKGDHFSSKPCRHFLRGYCQRGNSCCFQHSFTDADYHAQKVFLSGLPPDITEVSLRKQLSDLGCNVVNKLLSLHKSWPRVCLGSTQEAQMLLKRGKILISGRIVEVRSWQQVAEKQRERVEDITRRSVFLGGLPKGVTCKMIRMGIEKFDAKVMNLMQVKRGFCPKVTLASAQQAIKLVSAVKIEVMGSMVDVRPYRPRNSLNGSRK